MTTRQEHDSMGTVEVPVERYWGAQTQRSLENFRIGGHRFTRPMIRALGQVKFACAAANAELGLLTLEKRDAIQAAAHEVAQGVWDEEFPLVVWQTGSGTQTNMNVNEVIANRATELLGGVRGDQSVHPNDDVNKSQSTNDTFPTAIHMASVCEIEDTLMPAVRALRDTLAAKAEAFSDIVKIGRTHLMDATPVTLGQEFSGWVGQLDYALEALAHAVHLLLDLAVGGTAVGTGLNTRPGYAELVVAELRSITGKPFRSDGNRFALMGGKEGVVAAHGALNVLATSLFKIANDVRWLASGPRSGIAELVLPANEPGSSIMPGKVNPTQAEALTMVCCQVFGHNTAVTMAGASGNFELNVYMPMLAHNMMESTRLLADACDSFTRHCARGIQPNRDRIQELLDRSLMLVTALNPHIGYDKAAQVAKKAFAENKTLKQACVELGFLSEQEFENIVVPSEMVSPKTWT